MIRVNTTESRLKACLNRLLQQNRPDAEIWGETAREDEIDAIIARGIGGVGPAAFYSKVVGAVPIKGSEPGIYRGLL